MTYQCCQDNRVIQIPAELYYRISDAELQRLCTQGTGFHTSDVWYKSLAADKGVILTPEEVEDLEELEEDQEEEDTYVDLNLPDNYWDD